MNFSNQRDFSLRNAVPTAPEANDGIDAEYVLGAIQRQWRVVAAIALVGLLVGVFRVETSTPLYTSTISLILDKTNNRIEDALSSIGSGLFDDATVTSQLELIKSPETAEAVLDELDLLDDPRFTSRPPSLTQQLTGWAKGLVSGDPERTDRVDAVPVENTPADEALRRNRAVGLILASTNVSRVGRSYVISIDYTSPDPGLSAAIAQQLARSYLMVQLNAKFEATRLASDWLQARIDELRRKSLETDAKVQRFKSENGLLSADGQLVIEQNLAELNSQLIAATERTANAVARYESVRAVVEGNRTDALIPEAANNQTIVSLRDKYLEASRREADIVRRVGRDHGQAIRIREEMAEYQRLMMAELVRVADSLSNELGVAKAREAAARKAVDDATRRSESANDTLVTLREMEREAETYRTLYQTYLQRFQETVQQQSFPITDARILSKASVPIQPSAPRATLLIAFFTALGLAAGIALGAFRELRERTFRTSEQVSRDLGLPFLGFVPTLPRPLRGASSDPGSGARGKTEAAGDLASFVLRDPFSAFAETIRTTRAGVDRLPVEGGAIVVGILSMLPDEGKTTIASNLAHHLAAQGRRTLAIDADLRRFGMTRALAGRSLQAGLVEAIETGAPPETLILTHPESGLHVLAASAKGQVHNSSDLLGAPRMAEILAWARSHYDYVVVDLPPLIPLVDAQVLGTQIDGFVFVVHWGTTPRHLVTGTMAAEPAFFDRCVGVVLNRVDMKRLRRYAHYGSHGYHSAQYESGYR